MSSLEEFIQHSYIMKRLLYSLLDTSKTMCEKCIDLVLANVNVGAKLLTAKGKEFRTSSVAHDMVVIRASTGKKRPIHTRHIAEVYHYMRFDKKVVGGVGSGRGSIRSLVGKDGSLASCNACERSPAYIWGILANMPDVERDGNRLLTV